MVWAQPSDWTHLPSQLTPSQSHPGRAEPALHTPMIGQKYLNLQLYFCGSEEQVTPYKYSLQPGKQNEHRQPKERSPATAPWSHWERCCNKLFEYPAGPPSPWSNGWRDGLRAHLLVLRGPSGRQWRLWTTCPDHRSPASSGTCSPNEGCHGCTSYRYDYVFNAQEEGISENVFYCL